MHAVNNAIAQLVPPCIGLALWLNHYDVVAENIYTTNMGEFIKSIRFPYSIYKKQFPTGTWFLSKGVGSRGQLIEIDMEVHKETTSSKFLAFVRNSNSKKCCMLRFCYYNLK